MPRPKAQDTGRKNGNGRGTIDELPSGKYRWRITVGLKPDGTPIRKSETAATEKAAWAAMTQAQADHLRGEATHCTLGPVGEGRSSNDPAHLFGVEVELV